VFDCFDGTLLQYFRQATSITAEAPLKTYRTNEEIIEDIWQNRDRDYNVRCLAKRMHRVERQMSGEARDMFAAYVENGDMGKYAAGLAQELRNDFTGTMNLLRNQDFQNLLVNYPRPKRSFVIAYDVEDDVSSTYIFRDVAGKEYKPVDYLEEFARFVRENEDEIEAVRILMDRPKDWSTQALKELGTRLKANPLNFTVGKLQMAHEARYHKALVDIISMVKHAVIEEAPLLTAEERVAAAFEKVTAGRSFTEAQQKWLERIRAHLIENLSIDVEDFNVIPLFDNAGGWGRADRDFNGELGGLLKEFNEAIAA